MAKHKVDKLVDLTRSRWRRPTGWAVVCGIADVRNYLRRVKAYREKHGLPELKYLYVVEWEDGDGRRKRVHHHIIMSGMDRNVAESLWTLPPRGHS